jgi:quercetin dioxygenase-like cupin family protein
MEGMPSSRRTTESHDARPSGEGNDMIFTRSGGQTAAGPDDWFTGTVYIDTVRNPDEQTAIGCAHVRFAPGARTAWHSHPRGQTLYVTDGIGYVASRGGEVREIRPGDVVYVEPGEEHWHGATEDRFMAHVAMQEADPQGNVVTWLEHVSDSDYTRG